MVKIDFGGLPPFRSSVGPSRGLNGTRSSYAESGDRLAASEGARSGPTSPPSGSRLPEGRISDPGGRITGLTPYTSTPPSRRATISPSVRFTLHPTPYTLHPTPYTLHPKPYNLHPTPYILHPTPYTLHLHPTPFTYTLHPTSHTLHPTTKAPKPIMNADTKFSAPEKNKTRNAAIETLGDSVLDGCHEPGNCYSKARSLEPEIRQPGLRCRILRGGVPRVLDVGSEKVDIRLPEKEDSNSHGARPVH